MTNGDGIWQLRVRVADDTIALLGAEKPLREAMESWVSDPDGNISNRKVWSVTGFGDAADRPPIEMSLLAECIKGMVLKRGLA